MKPRFRIVECDFDKTPHRAAIFRKDDYAVVLLANRALRRHPEQFEEAFEAICPRLFEVYGWFPLGRYQVRWAAVNPTQQSVAFYTNAAEQGVVERTSEGYAESLDWSKPVEPLAHWMPRARPLSTEWEILAMDLLESGL